MKITSKQLQEMILVAIKKALLAEQAYTGPVKSLYSKNDAYDSHQTMNRADARETIETDIINLFPVVGRSRNTGRELRGKVLSGVMKQKLEKLKMTHANQPVSVESVWNRLVTHGQVKTFKGPDGRTYTKIKIEQ